MTCLLIDTSGPECAVALGRDGAIIASRSETIGRGHDARLAPLAEALLDEAGTAFDTLDEIIVCVGPGSFTGLRVGVAFARGLGLALEKPVRGVTSLQALIDPQDLSPGQRTLALLPAKRRPPDISYWAQRFEGVRTYLHPFEIDMTALLDHIETGTDVLFRPDDLVLPELPVSVSTQFTSPPRLQAMLSWATHYAGETISPVPAYVRPPDAALPTAPPLQRVSE